MSKFFSIVALFCIISVAVIAQEKDMRHGGYARVTALGNNPYVTDPELIKVNPAYALYYSNFIWGDIGSNSGAAFGNNSSGQFAGFNFKLSDNMVLGAILSRKDFMSHYSSISQLDPAGTNGVVNVLNGLVGAGKVVALDNNFEILGAMKFGEAKVGLGIAYASTNHENSPAGGGTATGSASQFGINLGVLMPLGGLKLDAGFSLIAPSATYEPAAPAKKSEASQTFISLYAKLPYKYSDNVSFVPLVAFQTMSGTVDNAGTSSDMPSMTMFTIGAGLKYTSGDFMLIGGPSFITTSITSKATTTDPELSDSYTSFPTWNIGAEWSLTDWLCARMGYVASTISETDETTATATTKNKMVMTKFGQSEATLGLGFHFGNFNLDAVVNADVFRQGLNNIGGGGATFSYLSASYAF